MYSKSVHLPVLDAATGSFLTADDRAGTCTSIAADCAASNAMTLVAGTVSSSSLASLEWGLKAVKRTREANNRPAWRDSRGQIVHGDSFRKEKISSVKWGLWDWSRGTPGRGCQKGNRQDGVNKHCRDAGNRVVAVERLDMRPNFVEIWVLLYT